MPYRINPENKKEVQVRKGGKWVRVKVHKDSKSAARHLYALRKNVEK